MNIVNWTLRNKLQWNFNRNSDIFFEENALESVVCEMAAILSRPQCVNHANCVAVYTSGAVVCEWAGEQWGPRSRQRVPLSHTTNRRYIGESLCLLWKFYLQFFENTLCSTFDSDDAIKSQFCTCHDSWAAVKCAKLWLDWIIILCVRANCNLQDLDNELINCLRNGSQRKTTWLDILYRHVALRFGFC